ncbi:MAG: hypothetical protein FJZ01_09310 [Candidatus Sericytochromatia bacterium]|nr:hypothetical protein [Candidatus Tanganyikabacteria bacterium]
MPAKSPTGAKRPANRTAKAATAPKADRDLLAGVRQQAIAAWRERSQEAPAATILGRAEALARELCRELAPQGLAALAEAWAAETEECGLTPFVMLGLPLEIAEHLRHAGADHLARQAQEFLLLAAQVRADRGEEQWGAALESQLDAVRSAHRLLVHEFVDPMWLAAGGTPALVAISLAEALAEARAAALPLFEARGQSAEINSPRALPPVRAERTRLRRLLIDLLAKASEYAPDGERIEITVARKGADRLAVAIRGSQAGLRASLKKAGCPTAKALLASLGGALTLEGVRGEGVTLLFSLATAVRA